MRLGKKYVAHRLFVKCINIVQDDVKFMRIRTRRHEIMISPGKLSFSAKQFC